MLLAIHHRTHKHLKYSKPFYTIVGINFSGTLPFKELYPQIRRHHQSNTTYKSSHKEARNKPKQAQPKPQSTQDEDSDGRSFLPHNGPAGHGREPQHQFVRYRGSQRRGLPPAWAGQAKAAGTQAGGSAAGAEAGGRRCFGHCWRRRRGRRKRRC